MKTPTFFIEQQYWSQGVSAIAGIDEAGMGALAGPVVAGAVIFSQESQEELIKATQKIPIRDSKLLSATQREKASHLIKKYAITWATGSASVEEIDAMNIRNASHLAMRRAIENLAIPPDMLIIDGTSDTVHPSIFSLCITKGDQLSYSIAAGSILAKLMRDSVMHTLHETYSTYGFASNKGYGSAAHMEALNTHGATAAHRKSYAPIAMLTKT